MLFLLRFSDNKLWRVHELLENLAYYLMMHLLTTYSLRWFKSRTIQLLK